MDTKEKSIILTPETCTNLLSIIESNDESNLDVASETIRYIDVEANLPYLLIMFKESKVSVRETVFIKTIKDKLNDVCKIITIEEASQSLTYNQMYEELRKHKVDSTALQFFLDRFSSKIEELMKGWGFSFIENCKLKIEPK